MKVANALDIDPALTHQTDSSLRIWYKKYNTYNKAVAKMMQMKAANTWTLEDIGRTELINLFAGQSYWHSHVSGAFSDIQNHKSMVEWLEQEEGDEEPPYLEVWHLQKSSYTFKDLDKEYQKQLKAKARQSE